jgi:hypothetical protein
MGYVFRPLGLYEVFFGSGESSEPARRLVRTIEEQWAVGGVQKAPYGPGIASLHRLVQGSQGTMGIVTWASMRCELLPSIEEPFVIGSSNINTLIEMASWFVRLRMVNECFILNSSDLATIFARNWPQGYLNLKQSLPPIFYFYVVAVTMFTGGKGRFSY